MHRSSMGGGLLIALVVLVLMSMTAMALVRAVSTASLIAGNFAFRQAAVLASEAGSEAAITWLSARISTATVFTDQMDHGYYASVPDGLELTTGGHQSGTVVIDWDDDDCSNRTGVQCLKASPSLDADPAGNVIRYTIHRLCRTAGSPEDSANSCLIYKNAQSASSKKSQLSYGASKHFQSDSQVYYRITTRVRGPRNTTVFTQALVHY